VTSRRLRPGKGQGFDPFAFEIAIAKSISASDELGQIVSFIAQDNPHWGGNFS
jgi:hypothetical protein